MDLPLLEHNSHQCFGGSWPASAQAEVGKLQRMLSQVGQEAPCQPALLPLPSVGVQIGVQPSHTLLALIGEDRSSPSIILQT